jgi:SepF-like predicted cell division protein (DUF552 family)
MSIALTSARGDSMGVFEQISRALGLGKGADIEDYMSTIEMEDVDVLHQAADFYVKPIALESEADVGTVMNELKARNIILLNVSPMVRQTSKLKGAIDSIKTFIVKINGDIARIDERRILLTPTKVKIVKTKKT